MDKAKFWKMIEVAREAANSNIEEQLDLLVEALSKEADEEIIKFDEILEDMIDIAYRAKLRDACQFLNCWCTDKGFEDFRAWLVAQGKSVFEKAIDNPDSLAVVVDAQDPHFFEYEQFAYAASYAYDRKNNNEIPRFPREKQTRAIEDMDEKDEEELAKLFPALMTKLGSCRERLNKVREEIRNKDHDGG